MLVSGIRGDYPNVVGLPVSRLIREISALCEDGRDAVADAIRKGASHAQR